MSFTETKTRKKEEKGCFGQAVEQIMIEQHDVVYACLEVSLRELGCDSTAGKIMFISQELAERVEEIATLHLLAPC